MMVEVVADEEEEEVVVVVEEGAMGIMTDRVVMIGALVVEMEVGTTTISHRTRMGRMRDMWARMVVSLEAAIVAAEATTTVVNREVVKVRVKEAKIRTTARTTRSTNGGDVLTGASRRRKRGRERRWAMGCRKFNTVGSSGTRNQLH